MQPELRETRFPQDSFFTKVQNKTANLQLQSGVTPEDGRATQPPVDEVSQDHEQHLRSAAEGHDEGCLGCEVCLHPPERQLHDGEGQQAVLDAHLDANGLLLRQWQACQLSQDGSNRQAQQRHRHPNHHDLGTDVGQDGRAHLVGHKDAAYHEHNAEGSYEHQQDAGEAGQAQLDQHAQRDGDGDEQERAQDLHEWHVQGGVHAQQPAVQGRRQRHGCSGHQGGDQRHGDGQGDVPSKQQAVQVTASTTRGRAGDDQAQGERRGQGDQPGHAVGIEWHHQELTHHTQKQWYGAPQQTPQHLHLHLAPEGTLVDENERQQGEQHRVLREMGQAPRLDEPGGRVIVRRHSDGVVCPLFNQNRHRVPVLVQVQQLDLQLSPAWEPGADVDDEAPERTRVVQAAVRHVHNGEDLRVQRADAHRLSPAVFPVGAPKPAGDHDHPVRVLRKLKFLQRSVPDSEEPAAAAVGRQVGAAVHGRRQVLAGLRPARSAGNQEKTTK